MVTAADKLADFRTRYGALAYESGLPLLLQQWSDLSALVARTDADLAAVIDRVKNLRKQARRRLRRSRRMSTRSRAVSSTMRAASC